MNYETIKHLAREVEGIGIADLCALAPANDPFYIGRKSQLAAARWFADLWERFGYSDGVHLRRVHYRIVSQDPPVLRPDGKPYENTLKDWAYLGSAGKWARYLDLVSPTAFVDRRNPAAILNADYGGDPTPDYWLDDLWGFSVDTPSFPDLPVLKVDGYTSGNLQPYHVEVWCEKTTMNDVLEPLCERYGVNLVTGAGEMSITSVVDFMARVREADRPARILYVSDYDPAGLGMPISVARKIEFFQRRNGDGGLDIRLQPIVLAADQVAEYSLPRIPVKDSDRRKANWIEHHGAGQVELDALEALRPGELERIVTEAILDYYDPDLDAGAREQKRELEEALEAASIEALRDLSPEIDALRSEFDQTVAAFEEAIEGMRERLTEVHTQATVRLRAVDVDTDDYPLPNADLPPESDGKLYISCRDYLAQLAAYRAYRHNEN